mmetsp:Transcript_126764/g.370517  ORF Transcript_126764/g.370517 Transcript_126764/m.370517 type:complete len:251 (+) Transcript_126764:989-1741(+)
MIRVLLVNAVVQHAVWVGHLQLLTPLQLELVGVREALRQEAPDAVRVQLQRKPHLLAELPGLANEVGARVGHDARHLHGVPPRTLAHDVPVEGVEDALVRQLQRVVEEHHVLCFHLLRHVAALLRLLEVLVPLLRLPLEHVAPVTEVSHRVDVEGVLPLAHSVRLVLVDRALEAPVGLLRELAHGLGDLSSLLLLHELAPLHAADLARHVLVVVPPLLVLHLVHDGLHICTRGHVQLAAPLPVHGPLALV